MPKFTVVVEETIRTAYLVEADSPDAARKLWEEEGSECGPIDWSQGRSADIVSVNPADEL
jgi:hypothetical protein